MAGNSVVMLEIKDLSIAYPQGKTLFSNVSFTLKKGEMLWLRGPNGCGKSSLLYAICNVIPQMISATRTGEVYYSGKLLNDISVNMLRPQMSLLLANPDWEFFMGTVYDEVVYSLENLGIESDEIDDRLEEVSEQLMTSDTCYKNLFNLSYGFKKLAALTVHASIKSDVLLLDEPFSGLSANANKTVCDWLRNYLNNSGIVVIADHSPDVQNLNPKILELNGF
jgi:energy-coupling factor transport system ATP-binding protein